MCNGGKGLFQPLNVFCGAKVEEMVQIHSQEVAHE